VGERPDHPGRWCCAGLGHHCAGRVRVDPGSLEPNRARQLQRIPLKGRTIRKFLEVLEDPHPPCASERPSLPKARWR
jgi:hypothetical protein